MCVKLVQPLQQCCRGVLFMSTLQTETNQEFEVQRLSRGHTARSDTGHGGGTCLWIKGSHINTKKQKASLSTGWLCPVASCKALTSPPPSPDPSSRTPTSNHSQGSVYIAQKGPGQTHLFPRAQWLTNKGPLADTGWRESPDSIHSALLQQHTVCPTMELES